MSNIHYNITANNEDFKRKLRENIQLIKDSGKEAINISSQIERQAKMMAAGLIAGFSVTAAGQFIREVENVRAQFQQLEIAFTTMLNSKEKANALMRQAINTAAKTPFDLNQVATGYKQLMAYGLEFEKLNDTLVTLGDVASGVGAPLNDIVYLYGTLNASGRVALMDIRQFAGRGIPIYEELAKVLGVAKDEVNEFASAGKISFEHVEQAFKNMTSEGGRFANLMEKQSASLGGLKANRDDALDMMRNKLGKELQPLFEKNIKTQVYLFENYEKIGKTIIGLVAAYGSYRAVLISISAVEQLYMKISRQAVLERNLALMQNIQLSNVEAIAAARTKLLSVAKQRLGTTLKSVAASLTPNPYVLAAAAVAGLTFSIYKLITTENAVNTATKAANNALEKQKQTAVEERQAVTELLNKLKDETITRRERQAIINELQSKYPQIFKNLDIENSKYLEQAETLKEINRLLDAKTKEDIQEDISKALEIKRRVDNPIYYDTRRVALNDAYDFLGLSFWQRLKLVDKEVSKSLDKYIKERQAQIDKMNDDEFQSLPNEKKLLILNQELETYKRQAEEIKKQLPVQHQNNEALSAILRTTNETKNGVSDVLAEWGQFDLQTQFNIIRLESLNKLINTTEQSISGLSKAGMDETYGQAKERAKKEYEDAKKLIEDIERTPALFTADKYRQAKEDLASKKSSYEALGGETSKPRTGKTRAELKRELDELKELEKKQEAEKERTIRDIYFKVEQSKVDAMKEGASKTEAQMKLNHEKELEELDRQREDYLQGKIDNAKALFEANPANKNKIFDGSDITLTETEDDNFKQIRKNKQQQQLNEQTDFINEQIIRDRDAWNTLIQEYGTYQEKRLAITEKYNRKINDAQTGGEKELLRFERDKKLNDLDFEEFKNSIDFAEIFSNIDEKSTSAVEVLRNKIALYIEQAVDKLNPEQLKVLSDALLNLDKAVENRKPTRGLAQSIEKAKDAYEKLAQAKKDGLSEDEVKTFETSFADAMMNVASKINIVIGHVQDFGNLAQDFVGIFSDDGAEMVGDIMNIASGAGQASAGLARMAGGDIIGGIKGLAKGITQVVGSIVKMHDAQKEKRIQKLQEQIDALSESYEVLGREIEKAYSKSAANLIEQQNTLLKQQQLLIRQQIEEEKKKKKTDNDRIKELQEQYNAITEQIDDNKDAAKNAIFGEDIQSAISAFADAYLSIFDSGIDKAQSSKDIVVRMIRAMIVEAMKDSIGSSFMENFRTQMQAFMDNDGLIDLNEQAQLEEMAYSMQEMLDEQFGWAENLLKKQQTQGAASYGAIKEITQDQANELIGRLTGIQIIIAESSGDIKSMSERINDIRGLNILMLEELQGINKNTKLLNDTNEKLDKLVKNTENL